MGRRLAIIITSLHFEILYVEAMKIFLSIKCTKCQGSCNGIQSNPIQRLGHVWHCCYHTCAMLIEVME